MPTAEVAAPNDSALLDQFYSLSDRLNEELVERDREIHGVLVALLSSQHAFFLGAPGVGKSFLVDRLMHYIDDTNYYKILLKRLTMPDELFGPIDVPALKESRWTRASKGYLPWATISFIDELWKGSSAILNGLLDVLNERQWRDDGEIKPVPLSSMFCASNEEPQEDGLAAIYDRIMLRYVVTPVQDTASFITMLERGKPHNGDPLLTWSAVETAKDEAKALPIPRAVFEKMADLRLKLKEAGIEPTDRRFVQSLDILRAEAWLDGAQSVTTSHMSILAHCLWDAPGQAPDVEQIVLELANPMERKAMKLLADIEDIASLVTDAGKAQMTEDDAHHRGMEIFNRTKAASKELAEIEAEAEGGRRLAETITRCKNRLFIVCNEMITKVFGMPESAAAGMAGLTQTEETK